MSLILDALKKSEQERRRDRGPDLQTIHQPSVIRAPRRSRSAVWIVLLIGTNAAVVFYWWQQHSVPVSASPVSAIIAPAPAIAPVERNPIPQPAAVSQSAPSAESAATAEYTRITPANAAPSAAVADSGVRIEEVDELPDDVRNNLPAMTFSFHVYSSNPQQRTIIINNRRMREGEEVSSGLQLQQITEDGVILQYAQHRIHISVLAGW